MVADRREQSSARPGRAPLGSATRGTTSPNRLRRVDRWLVAELAATLRAAERPLVVDLGFGASPVTTVELADRLGQVRPDVEVVGVEIDTERVRAAQPLARPGLRFVRGGFELGGLASRPVVVRAMNVLRQYDEDEVLAAWDTVGSLLAPGGAFVEGTCDEVGRLASWVHVGPGGPHTLTFSARPSTLGRPARLAERLPKALIHRNVEGERVHALLQLLDDAWSRSAPFAAFGARQRWLAAVGRTAQSWPVVGDPARWREGELTVPWSSVAPR